MRIANISNPFSSSPILMPRDAAVCAETITQDSGGTQYRAQISCTPDSPHAKLAQSLRQCGTLPVFEPDSNVLSWPTVYRGHEFTLFTAGSANATLISCLKGIENGDGKATSVGFFIIAPLLLPAAVAALIVVYYCCASVRQSCRNVVWRRPRPTAATVATHPFPAVAPAPRPPAPQSLLNYQPPSAFIELTRWQGGEPSLPPPAYMSGKASAS